MQTHLNLSEAVEGLIELDFGFYISGQSRGRGP